MSEEQKVILDMLSQGKITVEEAQNLLDSLGQPSREESDSTRPQSTSIMDGIVDTIRTGISNLNFSLGDSGRIVLEQRLTGKFAQQRVELDLAVRNGSLRVRGWDQDDFRLDIVKHVRASTREQAEEIVAACSFAQYGGDYLRAGDQECQGLANRVRVSLNLYLPDKHQYWGNIKSRNGSVEVRDIDMRGMNIRTVNGSLKCHNVSGQQVEVGTVNGSLVVEGNLDALVAKTTNGSITVTNLAEQFDAELETVNGRVAVNLPVRPQTGVAVEARTAAGKVRLEHPSFETLLEEGKVIGGRNVIVRTPNWESAQHKMDLRLRSVNGSIRVQPLE